MSSVVIRSATTQDMSALTEIYDHYIVNTPTTFDTVPWTTEQRQQWFTGFEDSTRKQLLVAEQAGAVVGYSSTTSFRTKAAYNSSVESSVYLRPEAAGQGLGTRLYRELFAALQGTGVHRVLAGVTLPNEASRALHLAMGFTSCGVMHEVGHKLGQYWDVEWFQLKLDAKNAGLASPERLE